METTETNIPPNVLDPASLLARIESLERQLAQLNQFLSIQPPQDTQPATLRIECHQLHVLSPSQPRHASFRLEHDEDGPHFSIAATPDSTSLEIGYDKEDGIRQLIYGTDGEARVWLGSDEKENGFLVVHDHHGKQNAIVRAGENGGALTVFFPNGNPAGTLLASHEGVGAAHIFNLEKHKVASIAASPELGGAFVAFNKAGEFGAILSAMDGGGFASVTSCTNEDSISFATHASGASLTVHGHTGESVGLSVAGSCSSLILCDASDNSIIDIKAMANTGGRLNVNRLDGTNAVQLSSTTAGDSISLGTQGKGATARLLVTADAVQLHLNPTGEKAQDALLLAATQDRTILHLSRNGQLRMVLTAEDDASRLAVFSPNDTEANIQITVKEEGGGIQIHGRDNVSHATLGSSVTGGFLTLDNELGITRIRQAIISDGGVMTLHWGGTLAVSAMATDDGGEIVVFDEKGEIAEMLPAADDDD